MRNNRTRGRARFFNELIPLANALEGIYLNTPRPLSTCKDVPALMEKRAAKLARRAARAATQVKP